MIARRLIITGRVQRVFYRDWTVATAQALGLQGWVRNRRDGSVEALLIGDEPQVTQMIDACRTGPPHAEVADIQIQEAKPEPLSGFEKRRTT
jgi:acylphosphatase